MSAPSSTAREVRSEDVCSFIPVAGCIISTFPIGFVALTEYGFMKLALVILMVFGVHVVEAYGLNPAIYSAHLRLHPLLVLTVLVVAEHSMGVWGLLLAVPITVFMLDYCIRCDPARAPRGACASVRTPPCPRFGTRVVYDPSHHSSTRHCCRRVYVRQPRRGRARCRYPDDTVHAVATKELEIVQGYGDSMDDGAAAMYMPSPGFTPDDSYMAPPDGAMSPEAQALIRQPDGVPPAGAPGFDGSGEARPASGAA